MNTKILPWLILICALGLSGTAAFYSVIGLATLFAGAYYAVIIMASFLEASKLIIATLLHTYWGSIGKGLRIYLIVSIFILSLITSVGIYGKLTHGYQETANKAGNIDSQIALIEVKRDNIQEQLAVYNEEKSTINTAISELRKGLSNNVIQYRDTSGQLITTTSSSTRRALEKQLDKAMERQEVINSKVDELNDKIFEYETEIVEIKTGNDLAGELGPLKYISGITGWDMDKVVNILLLVIIFVFDPLAISLVIAANVAFNKLKKKYKENIYGEKVKIEEEDWGDFLLDDEGNKSLIPQEKEDDTPKSQSPLTQEEKKILNRKDISGWRKNKLKKEISKRKDEDDDLIIKY